MEQIRELFKVIIQVMLLQIRKLLFLIICYNDHILRGNAQTNSLKNLSL